MFIRNVVSSVLANGKGRMMTVKIVNIDDHRALFIKYIVSTTTQVTTHQSNYNLVYHTFPVELSNTLDMFNGHGVLEDLKKTTNFITAAGQVV